MEPNKGLIVSDNYTPQPPSTDAQAAANQVIWTEGSSRGPKPPRNTNFVAIAIIAAIVLVGALVALMVTAAPNDSTDGAGEQTQIESADPSAPQTEDPNAGAGEDSGDGSATETPSAEEVAQALAGLKRLEADDKAALGSVDAPVVIIEYSDYKCPYCAVFSRDTMGSIKTDFIDKGLVRFEWRDFPIFGEQSVDAAMAARAAGEQGLFWEYNEALYAQAPESGHAELTRDVLADVAQKVGVADLDKFKTDLDSEELQQRVARDYQEASQIGVQSTPTFLVNGQVVQGAQPYEVFQQVIQGELDKVTD